MTSLNLPADRPRPSVPPPPTSPLAASTRSPTQYAWPHAEPIGRAAAPHRPEPGPRPGWTQTLLIVACGAIGVWGGALLGERFLGPDHPPLVLPNLDAHQGLPDSRSIIFSPKD